MIKNRIFSIFTRIDNESPHIPVIISENFDDVLEYLYLDFTHQDYCFYDTHRQKGINCLVVRNVESSILLKVLKEYKKKYLQDFKEYKKPFALIKSEN